MDDYLQDVWETNRVEWVEDFLKGFTLVMAGIIYFLFASGAVGF